MANVANLSVADAAAVAKVFKPLVVDKDEVIFRRTDLTSYAENPSLELSRRRPSPTNLNFKSTLKVKVPVMDSNAVPPVLAYEALATITLVYSRDTPLAARQDLFAFTKNVMADATIEAACTNEDFPY